MSMTDNPFARGYRNLYVARTLCISHDDDCPPVWRPLHASQTPLQDEKIARFPCLFNDSFALITEGQVVPEDLEEECTSSGVVQIVTYGVLAEDLEGRPVHVCDVYSETAAHEVMHQLSFDTGFYSHCWEISSRHLTEADTHYLVERADIDAATDDLFDAFHLPHDLSIGVKLLATPWTDDNLRLIEGITAEQLRQEHRRQGLSRSLANLLHLAGQADVRFLIFDPNAAVLNGLPVYDGSDIPR